MHLYRLSIKTSVIYLNQRDVIQQKNDQYNLVDAFVFLIVLSKLNLMNTPTFEIEYAHPIFFLKEALYFSNHCIAARIEFGHVFFYSKSI